MQYVDGWIVGWLVGC